jgi:hypothetical protein
MLVWYVAGHAVRSKAVRGYMTMPTPRALYGAAAIAVLGSVLYAVSDQVLAAVALLALAVVTSLMGVFVGSAGDGADDGDSRGARSSPQRNYVLQQSARR